ncbi:MAG: energy-coupling factor ABC transporter permease [Phycisphaerae bacterium]|nr:energy-coupling factor ABC transporter permease [Phycisphaerae bacterium]
MHMLNELLSVPVAAGTLAVAGGGIAFICRKVGKVITSEKVALMGIMGAFVFAAQMVNIPLPGMPGTSGHMVGAVLLAIILGPHAAAIAITSVVMVQCLIFQDGGLLALGCNIINMGLVPCYLGYYVYKLISAGKSGSVRIYVAAMAACLVAIETGAILVPVEALLSGVLSVPFLTFLKTMVAVHLIIGLIEGVITVGVLGYLQQVRGDIFSFGAGGKIRMSKRKVMVTFLIFTVVIGAGLSLLASDKPDGLEWSYADRPDQMDFEPMVSNGDAKIEAVDKFQAEYSPMPDYSIRSSEEVSAAWTSFAGVVGAILTMGFIWGIARIIRSNDKKGFGN